MCLNFQGFKSVTDTYHDLENVCCITLAPELSNAFPVIQELRKRNIIISVGEKNCNIFGWILMRVN